VTHYLQHRRSPRLTSSRALLLISQHLENNLQQITRTNYEAAQQSQPPKGRKKLQEAKNPTSKPRKSKHTRVTKMIKCVPH
jgi:hypothetical protein